MTIFARLAARRDRERFRKRERKRSALDIVKERALQDSAEMIEANLAEAMLIRSIEEVRAFALDRAPKEGLLLEFGVHHGVSLNGFADRLAQRGDPRSITGFDAFRGLSEDWHGTRLTAKNLFDLKGQAPPVRSNARVVVGWVEDTLGPFLAERNDPVAFAHVDLDIYGPSRHVLDALAPRFAPGAIVLFDEHHGYPNWRQGEYRALAEALPRERYRYRAFSGQAAVIEIVA